MPKDASMHTNGNEMDKKEQEKDLQKERTQEPNFGYAMYLAKLFTPMRT